MYPKDDLIKLLSIKNKIEAINTIIDRHKTITSALQDIEGQPAILMLLVAISEQFSKLSQKKATLLCHFHPDDIRGLISVRNYIAHDYDGLNLSIIEDDLRENMPKVLTIVTQILNDENTHKNG